MFFRDKLRCLVVMTFGSPAIIAHSLRLRPVALRHRLFAGFAFLGLFSCLSDTYYYDSVSMSSVFIVIIQG